MLSTVNSTMGIGHVTAGGCVTKRRRAAARRGGPRMITPDEALYSVSLPGAAARVADLVHAALLAQGIDAAGVHVVDATACVGGDTLALARRFAQVTAVERDAHRSRVLLGNLALARVGNVRVLCDDFVTCMDRFSDVDALYIDCPWGGPAYRLRDRVALELSGVPLETVLGRVVAGPAAPRVIALKVPFNVDAEPLTRVVREAGWTLRCEPVSNYYLLIATR